MVHALILQALLADVSGGQGGGLGGGLFGFLVAVAMIAGMWKVFSKAGQPGWAAIIPIFNTIILFKIAGKPLWWLLLLFIPVVNFIVLIVVLISLAERFGKGTGFALGLAFLPFIFYPMLGFGSSAYRTGY